MIGETRPWQSWTIYLDLEDAGSYLIENGELFREEPGNTYTPIGKVKTVPPQRGYERIKETGVLAVPLPDDRKRRELDLAELTPQTTQSILTDNTTRSTSPAK